MEVSDRWAGSFEYYRNFSSAEICTVLFKKTKQNESSNQQFCGQKQLFQADMKHTVSQITALYSYTEQKSISGHTACWTSRQIGFCFFHPKTQIWRYATTHRFTNIWWFLSSIQDRRFSSTFWCVINQKWSPWFHAAATLLAERVSNSCVLINM